MNKSRPKIDYWHEFIMTFSNRKSLFSSKKIERFIVFWVFLSLTVAYLIKNMHELEAWDFVEISAQISFQPCWVLSKNLIPSSLKFLEITTLPIFEVDVVLSQNTILLNLLFVFTHFNQFKIFLICIKIAVCVHNITTGNFYPYNTKSLFKFLTTAQSSQSKAYQTFLPL